jgi:hypothetical protein
VTQKLEPGDMKFSTLRAFYYGSQFAVLNWTFPIDIEQFRMTKRREPGDRNTRKKGMERWKLAMP